MNATLKDIVQRTPMLGSIVRRAYGQWMAHAMRRKLFPGSAAYWEKRYSAGANSGVGSYGLFAEFKAEILNEFVARHQVETVIEFGCGDGNQLTRAKYPEYLGIDVSSTAISTCRELFRDDGSKRFMLSSQYAGEHAELALSLDVIYHLVEDQVFEAYMRTLFNAGRRCIIVYSSDTDDNRGFDGLHVRHRKFTKWVLENVRTHKLVRHVPNRYPYQGDYRKGSFADFFIYEQY